MAYRLWKLTAAGVLWCFSSISLLFKSWRDGMNYDLLMSECISWWNELRSMSSSPENHTCVRFSSTAHWFMETWTGWLGHTKKEDVDTILFIHSFNPIILLPFRQLFVHLISYRRRALPMVFLSSFTPSSVFSVLSLCVKSTPPVTFVIVPPNRPHTLGWNSWAH